MVDISKHIDRGPEGTEGTEENVKVKIVLPLLEDLGWDLVDL